MKQVIWLFVLLLIGCSSSEKEDLFATYTNLEEVVYDIHLARSASYLQPVAIRDSMYKVYLEKVETLYNLDEGASVFILDALKEEPEPYVEMMGRIQQRLRDTMNVISNN